MYFASRLQAGRQLAAQIGPKYRNENCIVLALSDGGVMVGAQIAMELGCLMTMLSSAMIELPREPEAVAALAGDGSFSYNPAYSSGEIEDIVGEYRNLIEEEKLTKRHEINQIVGVDSLLDKSLLKKRNIILVSDGLVDGFLLDLAVQFLKPIETLKIVVATPLASVPAVDRIHVLADDIYVLSVVEDYISTDHYYSKQDVPAHEAAIRVINDLILSKK